MPDQQLVGYTEGEIMHTVSKEVIDEILNKKESELFNQLLQVREQVVKLEQENKDLYASNGLFFNCFQRAKERWEKAHPETNYWPDGEDNIIWLLEELDKLHDRCANLIDADKALEKVGAERDELLSRVEELKILSPLLEFFYTCKDCGQFVLRSQSRSRCVDIGEYEALCRSCWGIAKIEKPKAKSWE